jgi:hypothetical protein
MTRAPRATLTLVLATFLGRLAAPVASAADPGLGLRTHDVVAFVGGAALVSADREGLVETTLTLAHPGHHLRFRTVAWEGDTVFSRPRDPNFPPLPSLLARAGATVVVLQFGALESLADTPPPAAFGAAYARLLDDLRTALPAARLVLVIPPPFEPKAPPLPDLGPRNATLRQLADATRELAAARGLPVIDLFLVVPTQLAAGQAWTTDGRELSSAGHRAAAAAWAVTCQRPDLAERVREPAFWQRPDIAALREAVGTKNRLWFDFWRPTNWAFLHGDRTDQPSSRDHRDPKIRWFPAEMEQFPPLIAEAEVRIESLAAQARPAP